MQHFFYLGIRRKQNQSRIDFPIKTNMHSLPSFLSFPPCSLLPLPCCCLHLKIAQRKCSLLWQAGSSLLSCQATVERKVDGVSPASVSESREMRASASVGASNPNRETEPVVSLSVMKIMCPSIGKCKLTVQGALTCLHIGLLSPRKLFV